MILYVHVLMENFVFFSLGYITRNKIAESYDNCVLFWIAKQYSRIVSFKIGKISMPYFYFPKIVLGNLNNLHFHIYFRNIIFNFCKIITWVFLKNRVCVEFAICLYNIAILAVFYIVPWKWMSFHLFKSSLFFSKTFYSVHCTILHFFYFS